MKIYADVDTNVHTGETSTSIFEREDDVKQGGVRKEREVCSGSTAV